MSTMLPSMNQAASDLVTHQLYGANLYQNVASQFENSGLHGFSHWFRYAAKHERKMAHKTAKHFNRRGGRVLVGAIPAAPPEYSSPLDAFTAAHGHELAKTEKLKSLLQQSEREGDPQTGLYLEHLLGKQAKRENHARRYAEHLRLAGSDMGAILALNEKAHGRH